MEFPLNLKRGQQREFLDYLNSALRERMPTFTGSAGTNTERLYLSTVTGQFRVDQDSIPLSWQIKKDSQGTLLTLVVEPTDPKVTEDKWRTAVYEFVNSVLVTTLAETRKKYFRRSFFYYIGPQLDGEYWLPTFRFAPVYPADPEPALINAERVVSIDQEVEAVDRMHSFALANEASRRHAARLSLLLNTGLYHGHANLIWVCPRIDDQMATESVRYQSGFVNPSTNITQMPKKDEQCALGAYKGSLTDRYRVAGEMLSLPSEARKILRGIDNAEALVTDAFDSCARLYQVATVCGRYFPSVGLAYRVAAVEAVSKADPSCNGFSDFMRKHITSLKDLDDILDYMYGIGRSAHFHGGKFTMGEFEFDPFMIPLMDAEIAERDELHRTCYELTREAIVNWLSATIPEISKIDSPE